MPSVNKFSSSHQGECGAIWYDNGTMQMAQLDVRVIIVLKYYIRESKLNTNPIPLQILSRTYATVVAGVTKKMEYSHKTKQFTLAYHTTAACTANTTEVSNI